MKIALLGYGQMNQLVEAQAAAQGHAVHCAVSSEHARSGIEDLVKMLDGANVAIDFSIGGAVVANAAACARAGVPLVEGTTGWSAHEPEVRRLVNEQSGRLIYGANFSVGVNLFYRIVTAAAALFANSTDYDAFIEEAHHARKRDAPSGTALRLQNLLTEHLARAAGGGAAAAAAAAVPVASTRAGYIPGTHTVGFDSVADQVTLTHTARSREGFASGALLAANWIVTCEPGVYEFSEVFDEILLTTRTTKSRLMH